MVSCSPATQTVQVGQTATLTATGGNTTPRLYQWYAPDGSSTGTGNAGSHEAFRTQYATPGTKKITVESPRGVGLPFVDSVACTVIVTPIVTNN